MARQAGRVLMVVLRLLLTPVLIAGHSARALSDSNSRATQPSPVPSSLLGNVRVLINLHKLGCCNKQLAESFCQYGSLPGMWVDSPPSPLLGKWRGPGEGDVMHFLPRMPQAVVEKSGSRWQTFDPRCQLQPLITRFLDMKGFREAIPLHDPRHVKLLYLSDSTDKHGIGFLYDYFFDNFNNTAEYKVRACNHLMHFPWICSACDL